MSQNYTSYCQVMPLNGGFLNGKAQTFAVAARFTVQVSARNPITFGPEAIAFKPDALYLSEASVKASAWQIHDVRVNGESQLEGTELNGDLFSQRQPRGNRVITAGFNTIKAGGTFELDVSFQGNDAIERAPFHAGLFGQIVDPCYDITAYSGPIRLRGKEGELIAAACEGPARVLPGESAWFFARPKDTSFGLEHLAIAWPCQDWLIEDLCIDNRTVFMSGSPLPGDIFHPEALDTFMTCPLVAIDKPLAIKARYVGADSKGGRFGAVAYGTRDLDFRPHA